MRLAGIVLSLLMGIISVGCASGFGLKDLSPWASLGDPVNGRAIYVNHCIQCHGADGKGSPGITLVPPPADLSSDAVQSRLAHTLFRRIHGGKPNTAMGAWKGALADDGDIWDVLDYVRTLRDAKASQP
jgi:mono/diheme cytochrome c family protein